MRICLVQISVDASCSNIYVPDLCGIDHLENARMSQGSAFAQRITSQGKLLAIGGNVECEHAALGSIILGHGQSWYRHPPTILMTYALCGIVQCPG